MVIYQRQTGALKGTTGKNVYWMGSMALIRISSGRHHRRIMTECCYNVSVASRISHQLVVSAVVQALSLFR
jgi:hypothetical protein